MKTHVSGWLIKLAIREVNGLLFVFEDFFLYAVIIVARLPRYLYASAWRVLSRFGLWGLSF
ncbi:hypothetical protein [Vibrio phage J14]|nr:hypothetical protein [Vibrio phage J14]